MERRSAIRVRRLRARPGPAGAHPRVRGDRDRAAGLRPAGPSGAEPRTRRQQGRSAGRGVGRADRLEVDPDQSHQCGAQGDRRQRRGAAPDPHGRPQGIPVRRRGQGNAIVGRIGSELAGDRCDIRAGAGASRQALDRRPAVPEPERRSRAGVLRRRRGGGHHHGAVAHSLAVRHRAQFELHLQGPRGRREAGRPRAGRALCAGRQRAQGGEPGAHHRAAHRCDDRGASVGRPFRRHARRYLRAAGSDHRQRRRRDRAAARAGGDRAREAQADRKPRRLRLLSARHGEPPSGNAGRRSTRRCRCSTRRSSSIRISRRPMRWRRGAISGARSTAG